MAVLLTVLKIIGIILLVILGLILLILLLVLFVPIRYKISAARDKDDDDLRASAGISYLLHILTAGVTYEDKETDKYIKVFGIKINKKEDNTKPVNNEPEPATEEAANAAEETEDNTEETAADTETGAETEEETEYTIEEETEEKEEREDKEEESLADKINKILDAIERKYGNLTDRINGIRRKIRYWDKMLNDKGNRRAFELIKEETVKLLRRIAPKKIKGFIHFGFDDPATTGQILAVLGVFYPVLPKKLVIDAGFSDTDIYGYADIKGRIFLIVVAVSLLRIMLSKDCRRLWRLYKKKDMYC